MYSNLRIYCFNFYLTVINDFINCLHLHLIKMLNEDKNKHKITSLEISKITDKCTD